jgi:Flp pilus assembly protein TadD
MVSDDKDRDISGRKDKLEIQADQLNDDLSYDSDAASDIEQELERALADSEEGEATEEIDFNVTKEKKSGSVGKFIAPVLVLAMAAGAAGYIVMHPEIINRESWGLSAPVVAGTPPAESSDITLAQADLSEALPQPTATQNEVAPASGAPESAPVTDPIAPVAPAPEASAAPAADAAPAPVPPADTAVATASAPVPAAEVPASPPAAETPPAPAVEPEKSATVAAEPPKEEIKLAQAETPAAPPALSAPPDSTKLAVPVTDALAPDPGKLKDVTPPPISPTQGAKTEASVPPPIVPPVAEKPAKVSDAYYDSNAGMPSGKAGATAGPRKVDPNIEPGQKFVVVSGVRNASDSESMIVAAGRALKLGRYDAALDMYDALYAKNKRDPRILMGRAVAQQNLGKDDAAISSYRELLDIDPDATDALANMLGLLKKQEPATALQRMMDMAKRYPTNPGLAAQIGIAQGEMGNYPEAVRYLNMAATLDPSNPQHPFNMAVLADRQGDKTNAIKFYEQALQANAIGGEHSSVSKEVIYDRLSTLRGQ